MAARNAHVAISPNAWTELTDSDVTAITAQNLHDFQYVWLKATSGSAPTDHDGAIALPAGQMFVNETLEDLWPGATGAVRVFAMAQALDDHVMVSHA